MLHLLLGLLLSTSTLQAALAANTISLYRFENNGLDAASSNNCTSIGTPVFNSGNCSVVSGSTARYGPSTDANHYSTPAGLATAMNSQTWNVVEGYVYLLNAGSPANYQTIFANNAVTNILRLNATNTQLEWQTAAVAIDGGSLSINTCYNFAYVGTASSRKIYLNNVQVASDANNGIMPTGVGYFGSLTDLGFAGYSCNCYLDDVRFSGGSGSPPTSFPTVDPVANQVRSMTLENFPTPRFDGGPR